MKQIRDAIRANIIELLSKLERPRAGSLFVCGDIDDVEGMVVMKGDLSVVAQAIGQTMETNETYRDVMLSFVGAYLSRNPEEKAIFIDTLELDDSSINLN